MAKNIFSRLGINAPGEVAGAVRFDHPLTARSGDVWRGLAARGAAPFAPGIAANWRARPAWRKRHINGR